MSNGLLRPREMISRELLSPSQTIGIHGCQDSGQPAHYVYRLNRDPLQALSEEIKRRLALPRETDSQSPRQGCEQMPADTPSPAGPENTLSLAGPAAGPAPVAQEFPESIGHYRILRVLGEGGMGAVYEAEQEHPRRTVALKVIKAVWSNPDLIRRFEQESQALGRLHHPGIAQIYEAGSADTGFGRQPFFAMELIRGKPLTLYAESEQLNTRQRLELMIQVCEAVEHAHQRGIIHRDLKPGNILVDENGQPKILDFGLARFTDSDAHATRQTDVGQLLGTLAYMSPEQVLADPFALDTRSDVYALGIILYELLAGKLPYAIGRQLHEAVQTIRERDAAPLSTINRAYRGDVETIVSKALEKDKERRYASAAALALDLRRHLTDQPITAQPPSAAYQLEKFARRHKALVAGVAAVFVVLVAGVVASTLEAARARSAEKAALAAQQAATRDRDRAVRAESQAEQDRNRAQGAEAKALRDRNLALEQKKRADSAAATAAAVNGFLQNDLLAQASAANQSGPNARPDPDLKVRTALDRAAVRLDGKFNRQPEVEGAIRDTIGRTYGDLGLYRESRKQLESALELQRRTLGPGNAATLRTLNDLAETVVNQGKLDEAEPLFKRSLEISRRVLGPDDPGTLRAMHGLAYIDQVQGKFAQAEAIDAEALEINRRVRGSDNLTTLGAMTSLANLYALRGKYDQAEELFRRALEALRRVAGPEHPSTLDCMTDLASALTDRGKYAQAEELNSQALEIERRVLGPEHAATLTAMNRLGLDYDGLGQFAKAEELHRQALEISRRVLGPEHQTTLSALTNLGIDYEHLGQLAKAEELDIQSLEIHKRLFGIDHPGTLDSLNNLAIVYAEENKFDPAEKLFRQAFELERKVFGPEYPSTLRAMDNLAELLAVRGRYPEAEPLYRQALETRSRVLGPEQRDTLVSMQGLANTLGAQGRYAEAESLFSRDLEIRRRQSRGGNPGTLSVLSDFASMYQRQGRYDKAEAYAAEALAGRRTQAAASGDTADAAGALALAYVSEGKFAESRTLAREAVDFDRKKRPDEWQRFRDESLLGAALAGQKSLGEAEPLLLAGYRGMAERQEQMSASDRAYLRFAAGWLVQLYQDWGKAEQAANWRRKVLTGSSK